MQFGTMSVQRAKREHECRECKESIEFGDLHHSLAGSMVNKNGRYFFTQRFHNDCLTKFSTQRYEARRAPKDEALEKIAALPHEVFARRRQLLKYLSKDRARLMMQLNNGQTVPITLDTIARHLQELDDIGIDYPHVFSDTKLWVLIQEEAPNLGEALEGAGSPKNIPQVLRDFAAATPRKSVVKGEGLVG